LSICQLHILLSRTAQISLKLHFCVELHTKKALPRGSDGLYCFRRSFFFSETTITREALMKFCENMCLDDRSKSRGVQNYRPKVKVTGPDFRIFKYWEMGRKRLCTR